MYKHVLAGLAVALTLSGSLAAQTKTLTGPTQTVTGTIEAIETSSRQIYLKKPDGNTEVVYVPQEVKRFDTLKIGDKITAKYYENVVLRVQPPGSKPVDDASRAVTPAGTGGTAARQRTITATISAIDMKVPSISFSGPRGWNYSTKVEDKALLAKVKVGDKVDITWTEAMLVSID